MSENKHKYFLTACAIVKDEGKYLKNWINYHHTLGFEHFYIYDNGSTDDTKVVLQKYIDENIVTYINWPERPGQCSAYMNCCTNFKEESQWIGFFDIDEFLVETSDISITDFLKENPKIPGFGIYWSIYGSSGNEVFEDKPVCERFIRRAYRSFERNNLIKSIVQPGIIKNVTNPHIFIFKESKTVFDTNHKPLPNSKIFLAGWNLFRFNHYIIRSKEEFAWRLNRGNVKNCPGNRVICENSFFTNHDKNSIIDIKYSTNFTENYKYTIADETGNNILFPVSKDKYKKDINWKKYIEQNPDIKRIWKYPILGKIHYKLFGSKENRKIEYYDDKLIIFLHIAKTGGTSFRSWLYSIFYKDQVLNLYGDKVSGYDTGGFKNKEDIENYLKNLSEHKKSKIKCITGHLAYFGIHKFFTGKKVVYITIIREPMSLSESLYFHFKDRIVKNNMPEYKNWIKNESPLCKHFSYVFNINFDKNNLDIQSLFKLISQNIYIIHTETLKENVDTLTKIKVLPDITPEIKELNTRNNYEMENNLQSKYLDNNELLTSLPHLQKEIELYKMIIEYTQTKSKHQYDNADPF